jgi:acetylcholinesterase
MRAFTFFFAYTGLAGLSYGFPASPPALEVKTDSGVINGFIDSSTPNVRQFLGVPFAHPPVGHRRWLPPLRLQSNSSVDANDIGPGCPQGPVSSVADMSVYSPTGGNYTEYFALKDFSEDCLTLNIWTPRGAKTSLPVFVWYFGGGFTQGGTNSLYYNPQSWVQRTKEHIVVTVNFRSNIFGFPNAAGVAEQNLGMLDQRSALEWVRDNIANFGGDPSRIVAWGQSGGAIAIDYLNFAYPSDPIFSSMILDSSTALYPQAASRSFDTAQTNFTAVAVALGCEDAKSQVDCLRNSSWQDIEAVLAANSSLTFLPVVDNLIVFSNYTERYEMGALSTAPAIIGTNEHEFNIGIPVPLGPSYNQTTSDLKSNVTFLCTAALTSQLRQSNSRVTYRYRYDGDFPNISPPAYPGAYHASELPLLFGTADKYHGPSTAYENTVGRTLQDFWLDFARNAEHRLSKAGWGTYGKGKAVLIGEADQLVKEIDISQLDEVCKSLPAFT